MRPSYFVVLVAIAFVLSACSRSDLSPDKVEQKIENSQGTAIQAGRDAKVTINYQKSEDYRRLIEQRDKLRERVKKYPEDMEFPKELAAVEENIKAFERDVLQLAETINNTPQNSERLKQATAYFEAGEFDKARAVLDIKQLTREQEDLLKKKESVQKQLATNAQELILLAQATAIDYKLGEQRIPTTQKYFEQALKSDLSPDNLFAYARFLQDNNQFKLAEEIYRAVLSSYRELAKVNPTVYQPDVATTLNNLGLLVGAETSRRAEAEKLYAEALSSYRELAKANPTVYQPDVAMTLNNLGNLVGDETSRRAEAEKLYAEALSSYRELAKANPTVYQPDVANTLGAYGIANLQWSDQVAAAAPLLKEATDLLEPFAKQYPSIYGDKQAYFLFALAYTSQVDSEYCELMQRAEEVVQSNEEVKSWIAEVQPKCKAAGLLK